MHLACLRSECAWCPAALPAPPSEHERGLNPNGVVLLNVVLGCREQQSKIRDHCHLDLESSVRDWSFVSPSACWCAWILGSGRSPYALLGLVTLLLLSSRTSDCVRVMIETAVFSLRSTTGQPYHGATTGQARDKHGTTTGQPRDNRGTTAHTDRTPRTPRHATPRHATPRGH